MKEEKLKIKSMAAGIKAVLTDESIKVTAQVLGGQVQSEDGVENAISFIDEMATSFPYPWPIN